MTLSLSVSLSLFKYRLNSSRTWVFYTSTMIQKTKWDLLKYEDLLHLLSGWIFDIEAAMVNMKN